jgi:hypothetical protein
MAHTREHQKTCGIHSEPAFNETRLFISILPGSKKEITEMMENYKKRTDLVLRGGNFNYKEKYLKYKSKYLQLKKLMFL